MSVPATFDSIDSLLEFIRNNPEYCLAENCMNIYGCNRRETFGFEGCLRCKYIVAGTYKENKRNRE